MLQQAIDFIQDHRVLDLEWTVNETSATAEYCHFGIPYSLDVILHPEMLGDRLHLTILWRAECSEDSIQFSKTFNFTDDELDNISEFVASSTQAIFEHAEAVDMRD